MWLSALGICLLNQNVASTVDDEFRLQLLNPQLHGLCADLVTTAIEACTVSLEEERHPEETMISLTAVMMVRPAEKI